MRRIFLLLLAVGLWHSSVSAEGYYWRHSLKGGNYTSAVLACSSNIPNDSATYSYLYSGLSPNGVNFNCLYNRTAVSGSTSVVSEGVAIRVGTSCQEGTEYNPETGECVAPEEPEDPCADKAGEETGWSKSGKAPDGFMSVTSSGMATSPRQGCKGSCATEFTDKRCKYGTGGSYYCRGTAIYSGQQCATTGDGDQIDEDTNDSTEPETVKEDIPCIYSAAGGKQVCESKKSEEKEGQSCGSVNGVQTCIDKAPTKDVVDVKTEVATETNPDGTTTTTKTDTATVTKCSGINQCTTSSTTNTTTTNKDASGNVTSVSGKCVGEHCPDKKTDPDGDGDGLGDCVYGDCSDDEFRGPDNEDVPGFGDSLSTFMGKIQASPIVSGVQAIRMPEGGSCSIGSATTPIGSISGSVVCDNTHWLDPLYYVFLCIHALGAVRILMSA